MEAHRYRDASTGSQRGGEARGAIQRWGSGRHAVIVRWKMSSGMHCTTWGIEPGLCHNYKWKRSFNSCKMRKKIKERGCRKEGRKEGKEGRFCRSKNQY